ncbi:hypothetical protein AAFF_G00076790 [Aldrovandia affinis]|uniref:Uncharacterized protein n=1 Tax=Aldrovandia affinis TaxID=143900 RepID=A0AAD7RY44_9TELE|nr:hypothetical protein AAFF_G00076790 [Aldrovandia affinis]
MGCGVHGVPAGQDTSPRVKAPLAVFEVPERRLTMLTWKSSAPLPPSRGFTHLLTMVDRTTRSMKAALRASLKDDSWTDRSSMGTAGTATAPKEDLQSSSAELVFGQALRVPGLHPRTHDPLGCL